MSTTDRYVFEFDNLKDTSKDEPNATYSGTLNASGSHIFHGTNAECMTAMRTQSQIKKSACADVDMM